MEPIQLTWDGVLTPLRKMRCTEGGDDWGAKTSGRAAHGVVVLVDTEGLDGAEGAEEDHGAAG